jgi:hypothetical protein
MFEWSFHDMKITSSAFLFAISDSKEINSNLTVVLLKRLYGSGYTNHYHYTVLGYFQAF